MTYHNEQLYRPCVGIALFNAEGHVLIGERIGSPNAWQMPQGGIDDGEDPEIAVFREMEEEIGTRNACVIASVSEWLYYDVPDHIAHKLWGGRWRGQRQKWVALAFLGTDADILLDAHHAPEFTRWQWVPLSDLLSYVVPFKRDVYARVIEEFSSLSFPHTQQR